jgi:aryl-alcohol dehydrogenase
VEITAAVARGPEQEFTLEQLTLEDPKPGEVLVKIDSVGLCHTDLVAKAGHMFIEMPAVFGHEGAGTVAATGDGVTTLSPGDKVVLTFHSCASCAPCTDGFPSYCEQFIPLNYAGVRASDGTSPIRAADGPISGLFFGQSSFATYAIAHERNAIKLPADAPLDLVGPLGCGVQTGAGAVMNTLAAKAGSSLLVLGGGSVGLSGVLGGVVQGCSTIIVVEPHRARRDLAVELGATHTIDPTASDEPLGDQVRAILPGGVNNIFDTTGIPGVIEAAIAGAAQHAAVALVGVPSDPAHGLTLNLMQAMVLGLRVSAVIEGDSDPDEFIPRLAQLHADGKFPFDKMITKYPLEKINDAIAAQHAGNVVKVVLVND